MKKTLFMTFALASLFLAFGTSSAFASGNRFSRPNFPKQNTEKSVSSRKMPAQMGIPFSPQFKASKTKGKAAAPKADLFGTVSSLSPDNKTISVKDADGKETQVHVNPLTKIKSLPVQAKGQSKENAKKPEKKDSSFSDLKVGDWVMVSKIGGETKTLEAGRIMVAKPESE